MFKKDGELQKNCIQEQSRILSTVQSNLHRLFRMNPKALRLRIAEQRTIAALAVAVETGQFELIPALKMRLLKIRAERVTLATNQQILLGQMRADLLRIPLTMKRKMRSHFVLAGNPKLDVAPDATDIAPQYFPAENFSSEITAWTKYTYNVSELIKPAQISFLSAPGRWVAGPDDRPSTGGRWSSRGPWFQSRQSAVQRSCAVTLVPRGINQTNLTLARGPL